MAADDEGYPKRPSKRAEADRSFQKKHAVPPPPRAPQSRNRKIRDARSRRALVRQGTR